MTTEIEQESLLITRVSIKQCPKNERKPVTNQPYANETLDRCVSLSNMTKFHTFYRRKWAKMEIKRQPAMALGFPDGA
ncbi:hypothetical protein OUZ56_015441 [Daphnia magna]|uniref:Uncharacterized protein n=1 Tax=Daphnia magna TaxID=35525 RepID=A0ABR0ANB9_9CRUS|nr:hypothetical protein OUZ56_015441 [Daphnia magna]